ncbi:tRNA (guanosine(37)-N1)-methyltransferase TrmD [Arcanobacterium hippocoleae]|uniref:tRNA (guanosine(37)-N1)-methyltransferase TrmD n=1 Tax=Arcanobacterium hippocoleae TaxID=149017 RepID=UPI003342538C
MLAIPSPAGKQLQQADLHRLAQASQVVLACGRYEGIDARIAQYYGAKPDFQVFEFSLGDYVLNGGEVAAIALIEGISRLLPGMVGNPQSLVEESHGAAGLLEYPNYTRPGDFRGIPVPEILTSGNHGAIARWRKDRALERTACSRPDLIEKLNAADLDRKDRSKLAELGWFIAKEELHPVKLKYRRAAVADAFRLSEFAMRTWPDSCPTGMDQTVISQYIAKNLDPSAFEKYLADPLRFLVYVAEVETAGSSVTAGAGEIAAYVLIEITFEQDGVVDAHDGAPVDFAYADIQRDGPLIYLSKFYIARNWRGSGIFKQFANWCFAQTAAVLSDFPQPYIWLLTDIGNRHQQRAYRAIDFAHSGKCQFSIGDVSNTDVTMVRPLNMAK